MRSFAYRYWDAEYVLVGDWPVGVAAAAADGVHWELRLRALHDRLWSDSPPGLNDDADVAELLTLGELDHPLARALFLMYHAVQHRFARRISGERSPTINDRLRQVALRVLQEAPIAHVELADLPKLQARVAVPPSEGAYVRWTALSALRELAQAADAAVLLTRLVATVPHDTEAGVADPEEAAESVDERVEAVWALTALAEREPALVSSIALADRLLAQIKDDRSVAVRIAALQALMVVAPGPRAVAALHAIVDSNSGAAEELRWAATLALYGQDPAGSAALVLAVHRRSTRPDGFSALFTQLELIAEEAALRSALFRSGQPAPLIWRDPDCSVFALCQADGTPPPGADDPRLADTIAQWMTAIPAVRAELLARLAGSGHAAGRALAVLAGLPEDTTEPYDGDGDGDGDEEDAGGRGSEVNLEAAPRPQVDWLVLARQVLADPPLTRLSATQGRAHADQLTVAADSAATGGNIFPAELGQRAANHGAALELLGNLGSADDDGALVQYLLQASAAANEPLRLTTLEALYGHSRRHGQLPLGGPLLDAVTALARDGTIEERRRAVKLLGRFPGAATAATLRELAHDPTNTVCCIAERALAEQETQW